MMFLSIFAGLCCINTPSADMREKASSDSKVVSQGYYSEQVRVLEESGDWIRVQTIIDSYEGWIPKDVTTSCKDSPQDSAKVTSVAAHLYHVNDTEYGPRLTLPFESTLEVLDKSHPRWIKVRSVDGQECYIQRGDVTFTNSPKSIQEVLVLSEKFLNRPYTWGGRTSFGYDCSGFTQMLYRQMGHAIPRDSKDQITHTAFIATSIEELAPGDLIFWGLDEKRIRHVGLYLGNETFIHASARESMPWIRKSKLSDIEWDGSGKGEAGYAYRAFKTLKK